MTETRLPADDPRPRPSIAERAQRRSELDSSGRDRYDTLLRHLRAGQEVAVERRQGWRSRFDALDWHPIAGRLLLATAVLVALYLAVTAGAAYLRESRVDTWSGPDAAVQSGQQLASCADLVRLDDAVLPNWIRFRGEVFQLTESALPMGASNIGSYYIPSGYALGDLQLFEVKVEGIGPVGSRLIVRNGEAPAGQLYRRLDACA